MISKIDKIFLSDVRASSLPVRLLPFSLVPGMSINSRHFIKAVSILTKQREAASISNKAGDLASSSVSKGKKKTNSGAPF